MKKVLSLALAVCFTAATFAQTATPAAKPAATAVKNTPAAKQVEHKEHSAADKAKQFTDQINKAVPLGKEVYDKVMKVNLDFQTKKAQISGGKNMKDLPADKQKEIKDLKASRKTQLEAAMGKDLYTKWQAAQKNAPKGIAKPAAETEDDK